MSLSTSKAKMARFGLFEADFHQRFLTKGGLRVKLQDQPFQVLALLLERPGEIVTRDEIRQKLWPADTYVEFDDGLNTAIKKLRSALGDTADNPRFIETLPRRGYRFLAPVTFPIANDPTGAALSEIPAASVVIAAKERSHVVIEPAPSRPRVLWGWIALAVVLACGAAGFFYRSEQRAHQPSEVGTIPPSIKIRPSVAVIGFRNLSGRPESAWLSTALTEMLSTELSAGRALRLVAGENIVRTKRELALVDTDTLAPDTLARLHTNLDADYIILGSYTDLGPAAHGSIRLDLRLQDARTGETLAEEGLKGTEDNLFDLISKAGVRLRDRLNAGELSTEQVKAIRASLPENPEAARYFADGLAKLRLYDNLGARELLLHAIAIEPGHALAHVALAQSWRALGYDARARDEGEKAWRLSKDLSREDQLWIEAFYRVTTADWDKAIAIYRTLIEFFPDNLEYGLRLTEVQSDAGKAPDALETIANLRKLPMPLSSDPRIDLMEAYAANQLGEYSRMQEASAKAARKAESRGARLLLARAKLMQSAAARNLRDPKGAEALDEEAQRIYTDAGDTYGATRARIRIGDLLFERGEYARSNQISEECLQVFRSLGSQRDMANALDDIGGGLYEMGELAKARAAYEKALAAQKEVGNQRGTAQELNNLGVILVQQGDLPAALKVDEETRAVYQSVGDKDGVASALNNIGQIHLMRGDLPGAKKLYQDSMALRTSLANESEIAESMHNIAEVLGDQGDVSGAQKKYDDALSIRVRREENGAVAQTRLGKAELLLDIGKAKDAEPLARAAIEQFKKEHQLNDEMAAHGVLAQILLGLGRISEANSEITQAQHQVGKAESRDSRFAIQTAAAQVLAANGDLRAAIHSLQSTINEAEASGFFMRRIEASLVLAAVEMHSGEEAAGRIELNSVEHDARLKGYLLLASRAAALREDHRGKKSERGFVQMNNLFRKDWRADAADQRVRSRKALKG